jgi:Protein of unknown function (DUF1553)/Protein of unknown function (DUF1549)/Concanavalin A-like lectin/glucanases superfamily/Planctomycete cytochrome C
MRERKQSTARNPPCALRRAWSLLALVGPFSLAALAAPPRLERAARVPFNREIRPILAENCFTCHGPDHNKRMAGLRLDVREAAIARGAFLPGKPERSKLIDRVFAVEESRRMPPAFSHKRLTATQKNLLRRWIEQGAVYEPHWAYVRLPARVAVPPVKNAAWCRGPIDRFVLARLEREGLPPSPDIGKTGWLRRVTLDLTGLPPAPQDVDAFLADRSREAYARVVDRLLASPRYGERMAVPWLDVARYADSYGYQSDQLCPTWPYRDWVVKAFNDDLPYDQFITWQLAGDLLPNATREQQLATAFNRLHRMTNEGGSVPEEWRLEGVADRVHTFGTAFLGLTLECARCHDHKYDPIPQRDYYALSAFFNSIDEYGLYDRADIVPTPSLLLPTPEQERELAAAREAVTQAERALAQARAGGETAFRQWLGQARAPVLADLTGRFDFEQFEGTTLRNLAPGATHHGARLDEVPLVEGRVGKAAAFDGENNVNFPELGRFTRHTPFTIAFWMRAPTADGRPPTAASGDDSADRSARRLALQASTEAVGGQPSAVIFQACAGTDTGPHGYDLLLERGQLTARLFRHWPGNAIAVRTRRAVVPPETWTHVAVTYDGSSRAAGLWIYLDGNPAALEIVRDRLYKSTGQQTLVFGQRFRDRGFKGGRIDELSIFARDLTPLEVAQLFDAHRLAAALAEPRQHEAELRDTYFSAVDPEARRAAGALAAARQRLVAAEDAQLEVAVMEEMPAPRPTYVLQRGRYDAPKSDADRVGRDVTAAIMPFPRGLRRDRLGLAQWLTQPDHPLTARVAVNRLWAIFLGRGLVETVENFGLQGRPPSHPELLDWLARDFVQSGWNVKALVKQIVLSNTYRQASALGPELRRRDPQNLLLARGPSHRLSAEAIRDAALAAAGLLDDRMGGAPVSPYQPGDLWRESNSMSPPYRQSVGSDLYRRSLYTVWKRTAPMPNMLTFDAVSREVCVARRQTTSTPLQALVLLDDPQFVEAARVLGERALKEGGAAGAGRVRFTFRQLATREPSPAEVKLLLALYEQQRLLFSKQPDQAAKLIKIGARPPDPTLPPAELAAATVLAQTILNLDATIWER